MNDPAYIPVYAIKLNERITDLESTIDKLERRSGLMSRSWFTRIYTTWGYVIIAQLMIGIVVLVLGMVFSLI